MSIRRRLALSFGATLLLFCLNLLAHFVMSHRRDASLHRFEAAVHRDLLWTLLEHEYRTRWQELSVLSELPLTADQAREVETRISLLTARTASVEPPADAPEPMMTFEEQQKAFESAAHGWLDGRLVRPVDRNASQFAVVADGLTRLLAQLDTLKARDEERVTEATVQLLHLTALMNQISVSTFLLSLFLAAWIAIAFSRYLTGVLRTLQTGAERIGSGDLSCRIDHVSQDELGSLARSFNEMTDKLARTMGELKEARAQADRASRAKSAFLANMSHEFRTPMLAVQGYAELVQQQAEQLQQHELANDCQQIRMAGQHLMTLLNEVLDLSKIESGKMTLVIEELDLRRLVEEVAATVRPLVAQRANSFSVVMDDSLREIRGDEIKIRQILLNLIGNAAKFTESGTLALRVSRDAGTTDGERVVFEVTDTGIGMTQEQTQRIFEEFEQAEPTTARAFGGSGLGLAICKKLSRLMGGDISVDSKFGSGTTFTVRLPIGQAPADGQTLGDGQTPADESNARLRPVA
jgi:signal transduction histidine kinase